MVNASEQLPDWLRALYPFTPKRLEVEPGVNLSYLDEGPRSDEAILMVHGNPTWSFFYRSLVTALSPRFRCIVPDHVGMGLSDKPQVYPYTLARRIADIEVLVATLAIKRLHLIVHDWGGAIGFGAAGKIPDRIGRIVILNTAAFVSQDIPLRISLCRSWPLGSALVRGLNGFARPAVHMAMNRRALTRDERRAYLLPYDTWSNRVAVDAFVKDIPLERTHPTRPTLEAVEAGLAAFKEHSVTVVWGGRDFCFNDRFLMRWKIFLPNASVKRMGDVGHYVLDDGGEEAVEACIAGIEY